MADVKQLLDECYIRPAECDRKLFVFDRVQDMLAPAQNKLLKILEEPPQNVYFLLGTESEYPVLPTVRSRTKKLELASFPQGPLAEYIRKEYRLADAEEIAAMSGGVLGRAQALAEEGDIAERTQEIAQLALSLRRQRSPPSAANTVKRGRRPVFWRCCGLSSATCSCSALARAVCSRERQRPCSGGRQSGIRSPRSSVHRS